jgi:glycosyltransferase involved in cell wall biosynthesis
VRIFIDGIIFSEQRDGGISRVYREILPRIAILDPAIKFNLYVRRKLKTTELPCDPRIDRINERTIYPWRWLFGKSAVQTYWLQQAYRGAKPDIFHSTYYTFPSQSCSRYAVTVHDLTYEQFPEQYRKPHHLALIQRKRQCVERADMVLTISHSTARDIETHYSVPAHRIVVSHLGVSPAFQKIDDTQLQAFRQTYRLKRPFVLYVGRRRFYKNFLRLLNAYADSGLHREIDLITVGGEDTFTAEEQTIITLHNISTFVRRLPPLDEYELALAYNCASVFAYPSLYEGFGLPPLEAMACGTPVITSNTASLPEIVGNAALLFDPKRVDEIAAALTQSLDPDTAQSLRQKGLIRAAAFNWQETARQTLAYYRQLV